MIETALVLGAWAAVGVQVKRPLVKLMVAPAGAAAARVNRSADWTESTSVAEAEKVRVCPAAIVWSAIGASTGGSLIGVTRTMRNPMAGGAARPLLRLN